MIYGYCRVSTIDKQNNKRQRDNILKFNEKAIIYEEKVTGTNMDREMLIKLLKTVKKNDTIIFDSVSRLSREYSNGINLYFELMDKNINLIFLKERHIDSEKIKLQINESLKISLGVEKSEVIEATEKYIRKILVIQAKQQVKDIFIQAKKERDDLVQRIKEGIAISKARAIAEGKTYGVVKGSKYKIKKKEKIIEQIIKMSKKFEGNMYDREIIGILDVSTNTYYKYLREIKAEENKLKEEEIREHEEYIKEHGLATKIFKDK